MEINCSSQSRLIGRGDDDGDDDGNDDDDCGDGGIGDNWPTEIAA